nr:MAG TPA_asm: Endodeoxyribonuclease RusA [Caudoviricetes sp.]
MRLYIHVPARPEPQARPRANFKKGTMYSAHPDFYYAVFNAAWQKRPVTPFQNAVRLCVRFTYKRPATRHFEVYKTSRADLDNLEKAVMDALTQAKWWVDDALVADKRTVKVWGEQNGCEILAEGLKNVIGFGEDWK